MLTLAVFAILLGGATGAIKYFGCFEDPSNTDVPGIKIIDNSVRKCIRFCMSEDYMFTCQLRNPDDCYCGKSFGVGEGLLSSGRCYAFCPEKTAEECVGRFTNSVWYTSQKREDSTSESSDSSDLEDDNPVNRKRSGVVADQQMGGDALERQTRDADELAVYYGGFGMGFGSGGK